MSLDDITVTILTRNSARYLEQVLQPLTGFGEVLVLDSGSSDETLAIAADYPNVTIHHTVFNGFGAVHNLACDLAKNDWILSVDSDEVLSDELVTEISALEKGVDFVYETPRHTYYHGKLIKWCGWYPDHQRRLFNRTKTRFTDAKVHETVMVDGMQVRTLQHPIIHYSYADTSEFLAKMQSYSTLFAEQNKGKRKSSLCKAVVHGLFAFFRSYILKRGVLGGAEGFVISVYNANTAFYKYLKLAGY